LSLIANLLVNRKEEKLFGKKTTLNYPPQKKLLFEVTQKEGKENTGLEKMLQIPTQKAILSAGAGSLITLFYLAFYFPIKRKKKDLN